jgi:tetratricopeptide (TPR) repeat protein
MLQKRIKFFVLILIMVSYPVMRIDSAQCQGNKVEVSEKMNIRIIPEVVNGVTFIPIKNFYEALGWDVFWNAQDSKVTAENSKQKIVFKIGSSTVLVDGCYKIQIEAPVTVINNRAFVCSTFITGEFGLKVVWDKENNTLIVSDEEKKKIEINGKGNVIVVSDGLIVSIYEPYGIDTAQDMISHADRLLCGGNPEEALQKYREILDNISEAQSPQAYARILVEMGDSFSTLAETKDVGKNLNKAIELYRRALDIYKNNKIPDCQIIYNNLGLAYINLYEITHEKNYLLLAVEMFDEATSGNLSDENVSGYAAIECNKGRALIDLGYKESARPLLMDALNEYENQMKAYSIDANPYEWSDLMLRLGDLYLDMSLIDDAEKNLVKAKYVFEEALKVRNVESYPIDYANIHKSLGEVYTYLFGIKSSRDYLLDAIEEYTESIKIYSSDASSVKYAWANYKMGILYLGLGNMEDKIKNQMKAKALFEKASIVFNKSDYPELNKLISENVTLKN